MEKINIDVWASLRDANWQTLLLGRSDCATFKAQQTVLFRDCNFQVLS